MPTVFGSAAEESIAAVGAAAGSVVQLNVHVGDLEHLQLLAASSWLHRGTTVKGHGGSCAEAHSEAVVLGHGRAKRLSAFAFRLEYTEDRLISPVHPVLLVPQLAWRSAQKDLKTQHLNSQ